MNLKDTYNKIAKDWEMIRSKHDWWISGTDEFASLFKTGDLVADIGCGSGEKSKYLFNKGLNIVGIDFSEKMIEIAEKKVPLAKFYVRDIKDDLGFDGQFDGMFANAVLLHIPKKEVLQVIDNLLKNLKTGGYFYVAAKEIKPGKSDEEIKVEIDESLGYQYERFFSYFTLDEMKKYFEDSGLKICYENIVPSGHANKWIQVIGRK